MKSLAGRKSTKSQGTCQPTTPPSATTAVVTSSERLLRVSNPRQPRRERRSAAQTSSSMWAGALLSLVQLLQYCALIGRELQSDKIFSLWCWRKPSYAIKNQPKPLVIWGISCLALVLYGIRKGGFHARRGPIIPMRAKPGYRYIICLEIFVRFRRGTRNPDKGSMPAPPPGRRSQARIGRLW